MASDNLVLGDGFDGEREDVDGGDEVARERREGKVLGESLLPRRDLLQVLKVGERA